MSKDTHIGSCKAWQPGVLLWIRSCYSYITLLPSTDKKQAIEGTVS